MSASAMTSSVSEPDSTVMPAEPEGKNVVPPLMNRLPGSHTTMFWPSVTFTSETPLTGAASSNFSLVPDTACHWAKAARSAFSSAAVLVVDQPCAERW